ncbi:MAG TPA: hypothetical protein ENJ18_04835 [Nannocystis exedens]|nr:hypothetical protein [Nannocystis exedens]
MIASPPIVTGSQSTGGQSQRGGRAPPLVLLAVWLVATAMTLTLVIRRDTWQSGALDSLVATDQRSQESSSLWIHLRIQEPRPAADDLAAPEAADASADASADALQVAADQIHRDFPEHRRALAAPAQETSAWLNQHLLYLIPETQHEALARRLEPASIDNAVAGIRARLTSPLFAAAGDSPRRDPLGISQLLGDVTIGLRGRPGEVQASAAGDLRSADGRALLLEIRADDNPTTQVAALTQAVAKSNPEAAIQLRADGVPLREAASNAAVSRGLRRTVLSAAALVMMILALGLRLVRPLLVIGGATLTGLVVLVAGGGAIELLTLPLLAMMIGVAGEGRVQRQRQSIAVSGFAGPMILATALLPLLLAPYPLWHRWALAWMVAIAAFTVALRLLSAAEPKTSAKPPRGLALRLRPWPALAVLLCGGVLTAGALWSERVEIQGPAMIELGDPALQSAQVAIRRDFFDPDMLVTLDSSGADLEAALLRSIRDAHALAEGFSGELQNLDTPGAFVLSEEELDRRRAALNALEIGARMIDLEASLRRAELRPQAFSEFLRGATDLHTQPSPAAALRGTLRGWVAAHRVPSADGTVTLRSRAFLAGEPAQVLLPNDHGEALALRGSVLAEAADRRHLRDRLGLYAGAGLWIGALIIWLATRSLALALAAAITAVASECALIIALGAAGIPVTPALLPALLLVGAAGMIAGGRACRSIDRQRPLLVGALLLSSLCQIAAGLALIATPEPTWRAFGIAIASGCAIAPGLGIFATPGLYRLLRQLFREPDTGDSTHSTHSTHPNTSAPCDRPKNDREDPR